MKEFVSFFSRANKNLQIVEKIFWLLSFDLLLWKRVWNSWTNIISSWDQYWFQTPQSSQLSEQEVGITRKHEFYKWQHELTLPVDDHESFLNVIVAASDKISTLYHDECNHMKSIELIVRECQEICNIFVDLSEALFVERLI